MRALAVLGQPRAEGLTVKRGIGGVQRAERTRGQRRAEALGRRQVRVARERTGEVKRRRQRAAAQQHRRGVRAEHGDLQTLLHGHVAI